MLCLVFLALGAGLLPGQEPPTERERLLLDRLEKLEQRLAALESKTPPIVVSTVPASTPVVKAADDPASIAKDSPSLPGFLAGTTFNVDFDGYYGFNTNRPIGRVNLLRAYDVTSNNFSINQAGLIIERAPDAAAGRRLGVRVDLIYGQATETLQGSAANEPRPQVYRNLYQAYGSYVAPVGTGLQVDFGKFASSLGYETNYTKDQINYSRSYYFNYLPFYHTGFRATYHLNNKMTAQYWLVNGANQSEDFNGFKSQAVILTFTPTKSVSWNVNYYFGQEGRDLVPSQTGFSTTRVYPRPDGKEHIFDSYVNWNATSKLTLALEGDYVVNRNLRHDAPGHVIGGGGYAKYQFKPQFALGGRFEYLGDRSGLFSGANQALREGTASATYQPVDGFQFRLEYRRDYSNHPYFLTSQSGVLQRYQNTATLGLVWWLGGKQGSW